MKIKKVRIKQADEEYSKEVPLGANAANIDMKDGIDLQHKIDELEVKIETLLLQHGRNISGWPQESIGIDLDNFYTRGYFRVVSSSISDNLPSGISTGNGVLEVIGDKSIALEQIYTHYNGSKWNRMCWYGTWWPWKKINNEV